MSYVQSGRAEGDKADTKACIGVDVMLVLTSYDHVLLGLRQNTGAFDGLWSLPSGRLEEGEDVVGAVVRKAAEEIGLRVDRSELTLAGVVHCRYPQTAGRLGMFFAADFDPTRQGELRNAETNKCAQLAWFRLNDLPPRLIAYNAAGLDLVRGGEMYGALGWEVP